MLEDFLQAIYTKKYVTIEFIAKSDGELRKRKCVPFDYGASKTAKDKSNKFHFYDLDSPNGRHNLPLNPEQLQSLEVTTETFEPSNYVKWSPINWIIERDWGAYS
jgi:hypothetical protein